MALGTGPVVFESEGKRRQREAMIQVSRVFRKQKEALDTHARMTF